MPKPPVPDTDEVLALIDMLRYDLRELRRAFWNARYSHKQRRRMYRRLEKFQSEIDDWELF